MCELDLSEAVTLKKKRVGETGYRIYGYSVFSQIFCKPPNTVLKLKVYFFKVRDEENRDAVGLLASQAPVFSNPSVPGS